jgi:hypothetical protein
MKPKIDLSAISIGPDSPLVFPLDWKWTVWFNHGGLGGRVFIPDFFKDMNTPNTRGATYHTGVSQTVKVPVRPAHRLNLVLRNR